MRLIEFLMIEDLADAHQATFTYKYVGSSRSMKLLFEKGKVKLTSEGKDVSKTVNELKEKIYNTFNKQKQKK